MQGYWVLELRKNDYEPSLFRESLYQGTYVHSSMNYCSEGIEEGD